MLLWGIEHLPAVLGCVDVVGGTPLGAPGDAEPPQVPKAGFSFSSSHPSPVSAGETELVHFLSLLLRT